MSGSGWDEAWNADKLEPHEHAAMMQYLENQNWEGRLRRSRERRPPDDPDSVKPLSSSDYRRMQEESFAAAWRSAQPPDVGFHRFLRRTFGFLTKLSLLATLCGFVVGGIIAYASNGGDSPTTWTAPFVTLGFIGLGCFVVFGSIYSFFRD